jgi:hypothetical protein
MAPKANLFVSSLLLLGLTVPCFARIGETMDEAVERYGEVIRHGNIHGEELYSFKKNGFNILYDRTKDEITLSEVERIRL